MKPYHLGIQFLLMGSVAVAINMATVRLVSNSVPRQLIRKAKDASQATDVLLGNSLIAAGIDEAAFTRVLPNRKPLNLGLGATSPIEHLLVYSSLAVADGTVLYYGYYDNQLTAAPNLEWRELVGNRAIVFHHNPEIAQPFFTSRSYLDGWMFRILSKIPCFVDKQAYWGKVEQARRYVGDLGMPSKATNQFGRVEDFSLLEQDPEAFRAECRAFVETSSELTPAVAQFFARAKSLGTKAIAIEMPMTSDHRRKYYQTPEYLAYRDRIRLLLNEYDTQLLVASDWMEDKHFNDHVHLSSEGASSFSTRLAQWCLSPSVGTDPQTDSQDR
jgi:hypothetical protein